jgi:hypothetical protein
LDQTKPTLALSAEVQIVTRFHGATRDITFAWRFALSVPTGGNETNAARFVIRRLVSALSASVLRVNDQTQTAQDGADVDKQC